MSGFAERMLELQKQYSKLHNLKEQRERLYVTVRAKQKQLDAINASMDRATAEFRAIKMEVDAAELDVKSFQQKISKLKNQLQDIKTNKEYQAMQNEIKFAGIELRRNEDKELAAMDKLEKKQAELQQMKGEYQKIEADLNLASEEVERQAAGLQTEIDKAERDRQDIARELPNDFVATFDRLTTKYHDEPMVSVVVEQDGGEAIYSCGGCYMQLTQNLYLKLLGKSDEVIVCSSCGRILYLEG